MAASTERFDPYHKWLGIPPEEQPPSLYRLLGVKDFESDTNVIAHAADRVLAHIRTFHNGPRAAWSQRLLNELAMARACLLDPRKKERYDQSLQVKRGIQNLPRPAAEPPQASVAVAAAPTDSVKQIEAPSATPVRALVRRRRARKRMRELVSFVALLCMLLGLMAIAWILLRR